MKMKLAVLVVRALGVSLGAAGTMTAANEGGRKEQTGEPVIALAPQWQAMVDGDGRFDTFQGRDLAVSAETAVLSPDETRIAATAKGDGAIVMLDARDGREIWRRDGEAETECAAFTPDGRYLITGGEADPQLRVWRVADGDFVRGWRGRRSVEGMKFSPDGAWLATGDEAGQIHVYDTRAAEPKEWPATALHILTQGPDVDLTGMAQDGHADVNQVDWSADGARLYTGGRNGVVKLWRRADFRTGEPARVYKGNQGSIKGVRLSPRGDLVAAVSGALGPDVPSRVMVWREADGEVLISHDAHDLRVIETVAFDPGQRVLMAGGSAAGWRREKGPTLIWQVAAVEAGEASPVQRLWWYDVEFLTFDAAGQRLFSAHADGSVRAWGFSIRQGGGVGER